MVKFLLGASTAALVAASPALAAGPGCKDQLAQIKPQVTSELLAQSTEANRYKEAERLCAAGKDAEARALAGQISEDIARKRASGSSSAPAGAGAPGANAAGQSR